MFCCFVVCPYSFSTTLIRILTFKQKTWEIVDGRQFENKHLFIFYRNLKKLISKVRLLLVSFRTNLIVCRYENANVCCNHPTFDNIFVIRLRKSCPIYLFNKTTVYIITQCLNKNSLTTIKQNQNKKSRSLFFM